MINVAIVDDHPFADRWTKRALFQHLELPRLPLVQTAAKSA